MTLFPSDDTKSLSLLFHLNSEPWLNEEAYRAEPYHQEIRGVPQPLSRVPLPPADPSALAGLIRARSSRRRFEPRAMPLSVVSALAAAAYGAVEISTADGGGAFLRRSVPSGGGLFPLEIFLFLQRVEGLEEGIYHYDVLGHGLEQLSAGSNAQMLQACFYTFPFIEHANAVFCHAAVFSRTQKKYGPRGYRYLLLEAGHSAQNICLAAAEMQLGSLCMGGFVDSTLNRFLGLSEQDEGVVYAVAVGY